jgi:predicted nicotinamide N-methyase
MDYEPKALEYAKINEFLNGIPGVEWVVEDWRSPTLPPESFDRIWAGDVMYEEGFAQPIAAYLAAMLKSGGKAWIAEPRREIFHHLLDILHEHHLTYKLICYLPISPLTEQEMPVTVNIWQIAKA